MMHGQKSIKKIELKEFTFIANSVGCTFKFTYIALNLPVVAIFVFF
jgi:hypothetical protein